MEPVTIIAENMLRPFEFAQAMAASHVPITAATATAATVATSTAAASHVVHTVDMADIILVVGIILLILFLVGGLAYLATTHGSAQTMIVAGDYR